MPTNYDLAIIGSGGGAFAAAIRASTLGKSLVMIERGTLGGTCVNTGCVPSKALIAAAAARHAAADAPGRFPGITTAAGPVDMPTAVAGKQSLVDILRTAKYAEIADSYGWQTRRGFASFAGTPDAPVLDITDVDGNVETVTAEHYLIATGARPWAPPIPGLDEAGYLTSTAAMDLTQLPQSLLVLGGGYVALEQAQLFARLGSQVTLLARSQLASKEEPEVSRTLAEVFADEGIQVKRGAVPLHVTRTADGTVTVTSDVSGRLQEDRADQILVALGRRPATDAMNLATVGVHTGDSGQILVSDHLQSSNPRVWAAGDVTGHPQFVYVAARHGTLVADNSLAGAAKSVDYTRLPRVTFTNPAIGTVGITEEQARTAGIRCACRVLPLDHVPRAVVNRDTRGFIKIVTNAATGEVLGLTTVAENAGELVATGVHILGKTVTEIANAWTPYLTMAEGIQIAAKSFVTDVSKLSCCA
ncbi:Mercuric reductase (plasmid) [Tsukamurella tyrosinosolvens]|uniref:Mercuric reductase n=2 Tax=Tsukamurella TaxID=2060 RepID=A0A5C5RPX4_9ACTN|nr:MULTISPECIES: mercury(II) reductase [Tsukamurella]KXO95095.1 mercuric reductase [Tsukamurella tyrosinosolvens]TWS24145.1 mercury(II) reductase [Tsukamurella sputi]SED55394.1 mercuric reductase [Tsukamurella tyrosinosolvens]VEI01691.1 Mercuric reductase [Tsukamurella tyrosinosolvens]